MRQSFMTFNLQTSSLAAILVCAVCILLPLTTANLQNEVPTYDEFNKRDVGLRQCQAHPRNCPGGTFLDREAIAPITEEERLRAQAILDAGEEVKRSLQTLRNGLRYKLIQLLRPTFVASSEDSKELW